MEGVECGGKNLDLALWALGAPLWQGLCLSRHWNPNQSPWWGKLGCLKPRVLAFHKAALRQEERPACRQAVGMCVPTELISLYLKSPHPKD